MLVSHNTIMNDFNKEKQLPISAVEEFGNQLIEFWPLKEYLNGYLDIGYSRESVIVKLRLTSESAEDSFVMNCISIIRIISKSNPFLQEWVASQVMGEIIQKNTKVAQ